MSHMVHRSILKTGEHGHNESQKQFTCFFTGLLTRSRPFLTALDEGKTNLRSECSFVPNQALYQAEPQPVLIVNPSPSTVTRVLISPVLPHVARSKRRRKAFRRARGGTADGFCGTQISDLRVTSVWLSLCQGWLN
jgi:hypothetical protein